MWTPSDSNDGSTARTCNLQPATWNLHWNPALRPSTSSSSYAMCVARPHAHNKLTHTHTHATPSRRQNGQTLRACDALCAFMSMCVCLCLCVCIWQKQKQNQNQNQTINWRSISHPLAFHISPVRRVSFMAHAHCVPSWPIAICSLACNE